MKALKLAAVAALALGGTAAQAGPFINGSFEDGPNPGSFTTLTGGSTAINGWTVQGASVDYIGSYWQAGEGSRSIDLNGNASGGISQTFDTIAGLTYSVSFMLAGNTDGAPATKTALIVGAPGGGKAFETFSTAGTSHSNMGWQTYYYSFIAGTNSTTLTFLSQDEGAYGAALDNVSVAAVPEPATWALMILGFGLVGGAMRRRSQEGARVRFA